ncbi:hypothetical protein MCUN1_003620 [Malassezia cuniculi]|uniref:Phospholipid/glycerol acyltransferase domain-containing protein n=1 Tax=Malassezia cuniculi TaxID=948313 RepID=A0AAF0J7Z1_9BASI|nr:hypothetical protein MCUN1_003620 [Malassezia cuniculi]
MTEPPHAAENAGAKAPATTPSSVAAAKQNTLDHTYMDLIDFFKLLPIPMHKLMPKPLAMLIARLLFMRRLRATQMAFDVVIAFARMLSDIFFREIQPRSGHLIPKTGPIIFVGAPHHNQFLDPVLLASEVRKNAGRRVSFLIAQKSMTRKLVGTFATLMRCIPVVRAQDDIKQGKGRITVHPSGDPLLIQGIDTKFTTQLQRRGQIVLPKATEFATAEVAEIISDTEIRITTPLTGPNVDAALRGKLDATPAGQPPAQGSSYKYMPYVDQRQMYSSVYKSLSAGECIGIFPEGGSHDRTDLLPLKAGVVIMALGAMANEPNLNVRIVPVGLSYFHPHKFRSRAVVEFGDAIDVPRDLVTKFEQGGNNKREAIGTMLDIVYDGLKSVTLRAPDYETLMVIQAARRLYMIPGQQHSLSDVVELNRRFIMGYLEFKDDPLVIKLRESVMTYNKHLKQAGLRDHQVERASRSGLRSVGILLARIGLLLAWSGCALPGVILNLPVVIVANVVSHRKAKAALAASQVKLFGRDVLATWKILVSLVFVPVLYTSYAIAVTVMAYRRGWSRRAVIRTPFAVLGLLPFISMSTLKFAEVGVDVYKSLPPLVVSLLPGRRRFIDKLQQERVGLTHEIHRVVDELAPKILTDFDQLRHVQPLAQPPPIAAAELKKRGTLQSSLSHPLTMLDEWIFGWGTTQREGDNKDIGRDLEDALSVTRQDGDAYPHDTPVQIKGRRPRRNSDAFRQRHPSISPRKISPFAERLASESDNARTREQSQTPLSFLCDEALPILSEETGTLQDNLEQLREMQNALSTFNESFAMFLYGIKMNAFCAYKAPHSRSSG